MKRKKKPRKIQRMVAAVEEIQERKPTTKMVKIDLHRTTEYREIIEPSDKTSVIRTIAPCTLYQMHSSSFWTIPVIPTTTSKLKI